MTPSDMQHFLESLIKDPEWDPGSDQYSTHYLRLREIILSTGETAEGNLFSGWPIPDSPLEKLRGKRRNFALFATGGKRLLEIGFNAGHSCMLALTINTDLEVDAVDIGVHSYTEPCFNYLREIFGKRVRLHIGDSRDVLPALRRSGSKFDLYHVDGGHGFAVARTDICNVLEFAQDGGNMMVDDTHVAMIDALCEFYELQGNITRLMSRATMVAYA